MGLTCYTNWILHSWNVDTWMRGATCLWMLNKTYVITSVWSERNALVPFGNNWFHLMGKALMLAILDFGCCQSIHKTLNWIWEWKSLIIHKKIPLYTRNSKNKAFHQFYNDKHFHCSVEVCTFSLLVCFSHWFRLFNLVWNICNMHAFHLSFLKKLK